MTPYSSPLKYRDSSSSSSHTPPFKPRNFTSSPRAFTKIESSIFEAKSPSLQIGSPRSPISADKYLYSEELWDNLPINRWNVENREKALKLQERARILMNLEIPLNEENLKDLLKKTGELKHKHFFSHLPNREKETCAYPIMIPQKIGDLNCQLYIYPKEGKAGKRNSHEIFLCCMHSIGQGAYKKIHPLWSLTGKPERYALGVSSYCSKNEKLTANQEIHYLKKFNGFSFAPKFYKSSINNGLNFILMDYYPGDFFDYLVKKCESALPPVTATESLDKSTEEIEIKRTKEKIEMSLKLLNILNAIHLQGVVHRDVKPENILMDDKENPVLCDFSSSCPASSPDIEFPLGSIDYTPPEYWKPLKSGKGKKLFKNNEKRIQTAKASDMWSMGWVLWQLFNDKELPWCRYKDKLVAMQEMTPIEPDALYRISHLIWEMLQAKPLKRPSAEEAIIRFRDILKDFS